MLSRRLSYVSSNKTTKMKNKERLVAVMAVVVFALCLSQCSKKNSDAPVAVQAKAPAKLISLRADARQGNYLIDSNGHALYFFANDADGKNNCAGACAVAWQAFTGSSINADQLGQGLDPADFGTTPSPTGTAQLTYRGWPLYSFDPNGTPEAPDQISGDGIGGTWFVAKPDYSIMLANWQLVGKDGKNYKPDYTAGTGNTLYFTDGLGHTLYSFKADSVNRNRFTASDFSNNGLWPCYEIPGSLSFPSVLDKTDFTSTPVFGKTQLSYKGWPLYYFGGDSSRRAKNAGITVGSAPGTAGVKWTVMISGASPAPHQ
jgi:predicted lipoprotein with Yx(FWY)xxD motif